MAKKIKTTNSPSTNPPFGRAQADKQLKKSEQRDFKNDVFRTSWLEF